MPMPERAAHSKAFPAAPNTIVVFREGGNRGTTQVLAKHLGLSVAMEERSPDQPHVVTFPAVAEDTPGPVVLENVGIAALQTTDNEAEELRANPAVMAVVENKLRTIPEPDAWMLEVNSSTQQVAAALPATATWSLQAIHADQSRFSGKGVRIAVVDTGIDLTHQDFAGRIAASKSFVPNVPTALDGHGHGTHCAGSAAGARVPAAGPRYGVAPDANLIIGKVLTDQGSGYDTWILAGIAWAAQQGAKVISVSIGAARNPGDPVNAAYQAVISQLAANGVLVVIAAGNDSSRPLYKKPINSPGATPAAVAVAAVDQAQRVANFSCAEVPGDWAKLFIAAPGVDIWSAWKNGKYNTISGTSMATPHVAGVAALLLERTPGASVATIKQELQQMALPTADPPDDVGKGLVQAP